MHDYKCQHATVMTGVILVNTWTACACMNEGAINTKIHTHNNGLAHLVNDFKPALSRCFSLRNILPVSQSSTARPTPKPNYWEDISQSSALQYTF